MLRDASLRDAPQHEAGIGFRARRDESHLRSVTRKPSSISELSVRPSAAALRLARALRAESNRTVMRLVSVTWNHLYHLLNKARLSRCSILHAHLLL